VPPIVRPSARFGLILPLGLLAGVLAAGAARSQSLTAQPQVLAYQSNDVFAARWPANGLPSGNVIAVRSIPQSAYPATTPLAARQPRVPTQPKTELVKFATAPFPYDGQVPGTDRPFLDVVKDGQKGHRTARGSVLWQSETFNDSRVLLHIPAGFDINRPAVMVVFFHGHGADLTRDVMQRQNVPEQISLSGKNAVLVAPQFAVDAADSSAGRFWQPGGFARFVDEAAKKLATLQGTPRTAKQFANMPVIIVAYSGGYLPAAWSIREGGLGRRLHGLVLLDGLYGEIEHFANWIKSSKSVFFVSAYTQSTRRQNLALANILNEQNVSYSADIGKHLWRGHVAFLPASSDVSHQDFVTQAWTDNPIADILANLN
jgi:hypothetical protein